MLAALTADAQYRLLYESFTVGSNGDTSRTEVMATQNCLKISSADPAEENPIPGIAQNFTYIDYNRDTAFYQLYYSANEQYYYFVTSKTLIFEMFFVSLPPDIQRLALWQSTEN